MSDYMVGKGGGGKDRYTVGWNENKSNAYKVGGGGSSVGQADNKSLGAEDQASPAGQKSGFKYDTGDSADIGDRNENSNLGGTVFDGAGSDPNAAGGQVMLNYSEKGDWDANKNAMARRKSMMDSSKKYYSSNSEYNTPTASLIDVKKP